MNNIFFKRNNTKTITIRIILALIVVGCYIFIYGNSLKPAVESGEMSTSLLEKIAEIINLPWLDQHILRKIAHFTEFAGLGFFLTALNKYDRPFKSVLTPFIPFIGLISALIDETIQRFIEGRSGQVSDIWIDFGGVMAGGGFLLLCSLICSHFFTKSRNLSRPT